MIAISKRNVEKFFNDYQEYADLRDEVMKRFYEVHNGKGIINGIEEVEYALGDLFAIFRKAFNDGIEHTLIIMEDYTNPCEINPWLTKDGD